MEKGWSAVTVATGALGPVLAKLTALLGDEYRLLEESKRDIEFIKAALEPVHSLLLRAWELRQDPDAAPASKPPAWIVEARELSYDMDDHINDFVCSLEQGDSGGFVQQVTNDGPFGRLKIQVEALALIVDESGCCSPLGETIPSGDGKPVVDPRTGFFHKDASELVGMHGQEKDLIKFLVGRAASVQEQRIVCITASAGMGKTTLADLLYNEIGDQFQCRAFVPLSPTPQKKQVLYSTILKEVSNGEPPAASVTNREVDNQCLINEIANFLAHKRYLIVFDNIWHWSDWEDISSCLPNNDMGSGIIITTRNNDIAEKCGMNNNALVYKMLGMSMDAAVALSQRIVRASGNDYFQDQGIIDMTSCSIAHMSSGTPLGVICMSLAVAELNQKNGPSGYQLDFVLQEFCNIQCLRPLVDSLCLGFKVLPLHLQTCLLYCSIHHKSDQVERDQLTRMWIAEGFVQEEDEAQGYFSELVNLGFIRRCKRNDDSSSGFMTLQLVGGRQLEVPMYEINPLMLHFLKCESEANNLVTCWDHRGSQLLSASNPRRIRRLSAPRYQQDSIEDSMDVSHAMSLIVFNTESKMIPIKRFERLRVLDLSYFFIRNSDLVEICQLLLLRHLGLKGTSVSELPREIGGLCHLEFLDLRYTGVSELPREIGGLCHLEFLDLRYTGVRELPWEVGRTSESLRLLVGNRDSTDAVRLPRGVHATWKDMTLSSWLAKWSRDLSIILFDPFDESSWEPLPVAGCKFATRHMNLPLQVVKQHLSEVSTLYISIRELEEDDLKFLQHEMPNLQFLELTLGLLPRRPIAISGGGFSMLETFIVDSRLPRVIFHPGAMPKLRHLEFKFYAGQPCDEPMGITQLCSLQKVLFRSSRWYKSHAPGISTTIAVVRKEAMEHRNRIILCINGDQEVFPENNASSSYVSANGASGSSLENGVLQVKLAPNGIITVTEEVSAVRSGAGCSSRMIEIEETQEWRSIWQLENNEAICICNSSNWQLQYNELVMYFV